MLLRNRIWTLCTSAKLANWSRMKSVSAQHSADGDICPPASVVDAKLGSRCKYLARLLRSFKVTDFVLFFGTSVTVGVVNIYHFAHHLAPSFVNPAIPMEFSLHRHMRDEMRKFRVGKNPSSRPYPCCVISLSNCDM